MKYQKYYSQKNIIMPFICIFPAFLFLNKPSNSKVFIYRKWSHTDEISYMTTETQHVVHITLIDTSHTNDLEKYLQ